LGEAMAHFFRLFYVFCIALLSICMTLNLSAQNEPESEEPEEEIEVIAPPVVETDCPYFSGIPEFSINSSSDADFDAYNFWNGKKLVYVEGQLWSKHYAIKDENTKFSEQQILQFYQEAVKKKGGKILFNGKCEDEDCDEKKDFVVFTAQIINGEQELWLEIIPYNDGANYDLIVIDKGELKIIPTAEKIFETLNFEGRMILYVKFNKEGSEIDAASGAIIEELTRMMNENPTLSITIEAHTDNTLDKMDSYELTEKQANAVKTALIKNGIAENRLKALGFGSTNPIEKNNSDAMRAKNRRIEVVKK